jgi:hypothetical protein
MGCFLSWIVVAARHGALLDKAPILDSRRTREKRQDGKQL